MVSAWRKNNRRELRHTMARFLAIFAIVALGVGFFAGLKLAKPAMIRIGREFVDESNFYDYQLLSTIGLTGEDEAYFAAMDGVAAAEGSVTADLLTTVDGGQVVYKTHQLLNNINHVQLTAGRMPEAPNECLMDDLFLTGDMLGTQLPVENEDGHLFSQESYTVVGLCNTAQYLNIQRGTTRLGSGSVRGFLYIPAEGYDSEVYTEIFLRLEGSHAAFSEDYNAAMEQWEQPLTDALTQRGDLRKDEVYGEAQAELDEAYAEYEDGLAEYEEARADVDAELAEAKQELDDAAKQLADARKELEDGEATYEALKADPYSNEELAEARKQLDDGWAQLADGERQYQEGLAEFQTEKAKALPQLEDAKKQLDAAKQELDAGWAQFAAGLQEYESGKRTMTMVLSPLQSAVREAGSRVSAARQEVSRCQRELAMLGGDPIANGAQIVAVTAELTAAQAELTAAQAAYEAADALYTSTKSELDAQLAEGEQQIAEGKAQLDEGQKQYDEGLKQYEDGMQQLADAEAQLKAAADEIAYSRKLLEDGEQELTEGIETALTEGRKALDDGWKELADGEAQYADGLRQYEEGVAEADEEFADARAELDEAAEALAEAQEQVDSLKDPSYYALDRMSNAGYASFDNDTSIVDGVAKVFPLFFFLVAALVCSSTMTRMVEEQRTQNGTLKALGYSDGQILWRYASYAGGAALLGAVVGYFLCAWLFPYVIWHAYKMLYHFGEIKLLLDWKLAAIALFFALLCSVGAACAAAWSEMRQMPAQLMRPKAPKAGKRVFLEYITPLWKRLDFLHKVSARNILRYKKRLFMMMLGVGGCMALLLAGLGMRDSIANVAEDQFTGITVYDYAITFSEHRTPEDQAAFRQEADLSSCAFVGVLATDVLTEQGIKNVSVVATDDPAITEVIRLHDGETDLAYPTGDGVYVSSKLAELAEIGAGDTVTLQLENKELIHLPVEAVFDNYVNHYIYMTGEAYEKWFGEPISCEAAYAKTDEADVYAVSAELQKLDSVVNVTVSQDFRNMITDTLVSLDAVVALVVGCAVALSFVVSYNLCNINITERVREIATIKVLGFYPKETHAYVFRETVVLTFLGTLAGIPLGIWLHRFVLNQVQVDMVAFQPRIAPMSFVLAVLITFAITGLVDLLLRKKIDRIHMAESLKSVE